MIWIQVAIIVVQIVIALVSYLTIYRHRSIYSIKTAILRPPHGDPLDIYSLNIEPINEDLKDGKYTILQIVERPDKEWQVIMGKLKK